jgi:hypothetical protein
MTPTVEIHPAWWFTCDACGRDSFFRGVIASMSPEEQFEAREHFGAPEDEAGAFMQVPDQVVCTHCGAIAEVTWEDEE